MTSWGITVESLRAFMAHRIDANATVEESNRNVKSETQTESSVRYFENSKMELAAFELEVLCALHRGSSRSIVATVRTVVGGFTRH